jgi:60 kDa SS-A/Ro ribonucleoprotein
VVDDAYSTFSTRGTPQGQRADARQQANNAGGFTFTVDPLARAKRFLILGSDAGTYYQEAPDLTRDNAGVIVALAEQDGRALVDLIVDVSVGGKAPRQNPALFALAIAASIGPDESRAYALSKLSAVARTGTHLFLFARYVEQFRGWGRGLRKAVGNWYLERPVDELAYQVVKYRQREGWSHRDLLRLTHPVTAEAQRRALFDWIARRPADGVPRIVEGFLKAQEGGDAAALVREYGLSWEMLPDEALAEASTWDALLDVGMPQTALLRQLPRLTRLGIVKRFGGRTSEIAAQLKDPERLRKARVHPISVLVALRTYAAGQGRGSTWQPVQKIVDALDAGFYAAFGAVEPAGKRTLIALDVSGSMDWIRDSATQLTPREVGAALSLVINATEPDSSVFGFSTQFTQLAISPRQRLDDVIRYTSRIPMGGTDCALPMVEALRNRWEVDTFVVITDNETWAGGIHPHEALAQYRRQTGIPAKLVVLACTATRFSIADPSDAGMLDVAGFGTDVPQLITEFSRGF